MRNFTSAVAFSLGTGNLFKNPKFVLDSFKQSFNTIQPQFLFIIVAVKFFEGFFNFISFCF